MVIDALGFAFGDRADPGLVRAGAAKAAVFVEMEPNGVMLAWLADNGFEGDAGEPVVISRDLAAQGRSSARINGKPATAAQLRELADQLLDVVGQNEHARTAMPARHRELLDAFGGSRVSELRESVAALHAQAKDLHARLDASVMSEADALRALEDARYAAREIEAARLKAGEFETLRERRNVLANAAKIAQAMHVAREAIDASDAGAVASLGRAASALDGIAGLSGPLSELRDQARGLQGAVQDFAIAVAAVADVEPAAPAELETVEDRLALLENLAKKYGPTIQAVVEAGQRFAAKAQSLEQRDEEIAHLRERLDACERDLARAAAGLTAERKKAATALAARVQQELGALGMRGATFRCGVDSRPDGIGPSGADRVEFFASLNPNEPERPIAKAASGGELSRLLLALKVALADVDPHPIVVLDEIDAGIGGAAARAVGSRIARLARSVQVLCVTHLAQIAAFADEHVALEKVPLKGRVIIQARVLEGREEKAAEIARMLSGDSSGKEALRHAESLLRDVATSQ